MLAILILGGEVLPSSGNNETTGLILRVALFLLFLIVFVAACCYAWRNVPALKAIVPPPARYIRQPEVAVNEPSSSQLEPMSDLTVAEFLAAESHKVEPPEVQTVPTGDHTSQN